MSGKNINKSFLVRLNKETLKEKALTLGLDENNSPKPLKKMLKEDYINFILQMKTTLQDDLVELFKNLTIEPKIESIETSLVPKTVTFKERPISESLIPSVMSTIVEEKSILKKPKPIVVEEKPVVVEEKPKPVVVEETKIVPLVSLPEYNVESEEEIIHIKVLENQIKNAKDVSDILRAIKSPNNVHLSVLSAIDSQMARLFGLTFN